MVKGRQTSASSSTRKKHARKAAAQSQQPAQEPLPANKVKKKDKGSKKEPRPKIYIPPVKPQPLQADPLDTLGLASKLPPDLYVVLRKLGKKDEVTKGKALEELQAGWLSRLGKSGDEDALENPVIVMLPVWVRRAVLMSGS